ncbi:MAG TPA: GMC family oxidoreductase N-terminal domain-containing protein [Candidatus Kapabacteria bacterium]|nr:GMC family oxidoreductase N-terminal domain-containing protein [Candidatus Kapabacteria bacterium]
MISIANFRGYAGHDPLDQVSGGQRMILGLSISFVIALVLNYVQSGPIPIIHFREDWLIIAGSIAMAIVMGPILIIFRKSSSLLFYFIVVVAGFSVDMYLQANIRDAGGVGCWMYNDGNFISNVSIYPLRFIIAWSFDGFILGAFTLWLIRIAATIIWKEKDTQPTIEQKQNLFPDEWTKETVAKPVRDIEYWVLRLLALGYFLYVLLLVAGFLGISPWPVAIKNLLVMAFENPELLINTFSKIMVMVLCGWIGAYNKQVRWYSTLVMFIAHLVSTAGSLSFYFYEAPSVPYHDFLMTSAITDGVMVVIFAWILIRNKASRDYFRIKMPSAYSIPLRLTKYFFYILAGVMFGFIGVALYARFALDGNSGLGAVFGSPDAMLCNTFTMCTAMGTLAILMARYEKLRESLMGTLVFAYVITVVVTIPWMILGKMLILTRSGSLVSVPSYYVMHFVLDGLSAALIIAFRKMTYNIDYVITAINPSSARNVESLDAAFFGGDEQDQTSVLQMIDKYVAGIRGRKRGLLNFPFWLVEHIFPTLYAFHPTFSSMSVDEQRCFLRKYLMRTPNERERSFIPELADLAEQIGIASYSLVANAHYSLANNRASIGFIPAEARNAIQGELRNEYPPTSGAAPLPIDHRDKYNFKPDTSFSAKLVAPRVVTRTDEPRIPDEVDYIVLGSGAGGATCAYRLASSGVTDPSQILLVERGNRYSPLQDMNDNEMEMLQKLYKEGGLQLTKKFDMMILQGEAVGGTTVINNAVCLQMPDVVRAEWQNIYGIDLSNLDAEYRQTQEELDIHLLNSDHGINKNVRDIFTKAVNGYNATHSEQLLDDKQQPNIEELTVNYRNDLGDGFWNMGNKYMRKRSMLESYIPWAEGRGMKTVSGTTAVKLFSANGAAEGVLLRMNTGALKIVKVRKAVVLAGGVISSSHFLMQSGIMKNIGERVACNFAFPASLEFDSTLDAWDGTQITLGIRGPDNKAMFETYFNPPASFALSLPFQFERRERAMSSYRRLVNFGALVGSEPRGMIQEKADLINGRPIDWSLGTRDVSNVRYALKTLVELGYSAGAKKIILPTRPGIEFELTQPTVERFCDAIDDYPLRMEDVFFATAHPQGGNMMAGDSSQMRNMRVVNSAFQVDGLSNVYVADASLFPSGITVNPQWTILAMSSLAAKSILTHHA